MNSLILWFFRIAAKGWIPASWFEPDLPPVSQRHAREGKLSIEVVSHCWQYSHFLAYQLSSLVNFSPKDVSVTMTVFYNSEDTSTQKLLDFFGGLEVDNVKWNWRDIAKDHLFRRGIGRNLAALETQADWVWFTDCDLMFQEDCLDKLGMILQGRKEALLFPQEERCTDLLAEDNPMLQAGHSEPQVLSLDTTVFTARKRTRATGPLQISHGDVCRAVGYCRNIKLYQTPSDEWCKAHEDRAFRWLVKSQGIPIDLPGVYRIRHVAKGRYTGTKTMNGFRTLLRKAQSAWRGNKRA